ncbi:MAG: NfeD family protein [Prevotella sp.]|jgi:membrane protein implicated in regulation of membrane protease activity|nr:NfeD family protein [Prevotella sp.]
MIEYFAANMWQLWAAIAVICLILELSSGDFFIICFSIGAVFGLLSALLGLNIYGQILLFALFSLLSIFLVRPVALRYLHRNEEQRVSNADALMGRVGHVVETVKANGYGRVQIDGDIWKSVTNEATDIPAGTRVRVIGRESTIITVEKLEG